MAPTSVFCNIFFLFTAFALAAPQYQPRIEHNVAKRASNFWMENVQRQGSVAYGSDPGYQVFRNVKEFGAVGDGNADDTAAINLAITQGSRCGDGCNSSTTTPALVYFPAGTYRITAPLIMYYYTQMIGDPTNLPTIKGDSSFNGIALIDTDPYIPGANGAQWYTNQNQFFRQIRNFNFDLTSMPVGPGANGQVSTAIHWQVAQASSLQNIAFNMAPKSADNKQQAIMMENGSGQFFSDLTFTGGNIGIYGGTQQVTNRNMTFNGVNTAIFLIWDWLWNFKSITITDCDIGIDMSSVNGSNYQAVGSAIIMDSKISANKYGILTSYSTTNNLPATGGTMLIQNVDFSGTTGGAAVVGAAGQDTILNSQGVVSMWGQGHAYLPGGSAAGNAKRAPQEQSTSPASAVTSDASQPAFPTSLATTVTTVSFAGFNSSTAPQATVATACSSGAVAVSTTTINQGQFSAPTIPAALLDSNGKVFERGKPQYNDVPASSFISVKSKGAKGDGTSDDTDAIQNALNGLSDGQILYFDHGAYVISKTVNVPSNAKMVGEMWPLIMFDGSSTTFSDVNNPQPGFRIGNPGDTGSVEIQDIIFETRGAAPGCIMMEWNLAGSSQGAAAMWDTHFRVGGTAGTLLQQDTCQGNLTRPAQFNAECYGSFMMVHITQQASAYLENTWFWLADHELDMPGNEQLNIFNGRGVLVESQGPTWLVGTSSEHHVLYNYQVANAKNLWMGAIQTETPYFQSGPDSLSGGFTPNAAYSDPTFDNCGDEKCKKAWGLRVIDSQDIFVHGAGMYSFYEQDLQTECLAGENCQDNMVDIECSSNVNIFGMVTKASTNQVIVDGQPVVKQADNTNGFGSTVLLFEQQ